MGKNQLHLYTPPPNTKASGSSILIIVDNDIARLILNSSINLSASNVMSVYKAQKFLLLSRFFLNFLLYFFANPKPEIKLSTSALSLKLVM